jgi:acetyl-CoA acetyltransferase
MRQEVAILGVGMHPWGKIKDKSVPGLNVEASREALKNAGVDWNDIQLVVAGEDPWTGIQGMLAGSKLHQDMGWTGIPTVNLYQACASGGYALKTATAYIMAGMADIALVTAASISPKGAFGPNKVTDEFDGNDIDTQRFRVLGLTNPTTFAMLAMRRMANYGMTENDLALVKVKNSKYAVHNPYARYRTEYTVEEVLNSPYVAYPIRLLEVCATSDGAAALVLCSMKKAKQYTTKPVVLAAVGTQSPKFPDPDANVNDFSLDFSDVAAPRANYNGQRASKSAYEIAGIGPEDLDFAEVYDLSSASELQWYEDIGVCKPGEAEVLLREGATALGGRIPINTDGGCSSSGEAIPAQALSQAVELVRQVRGEAGPRQVENAKVGFAVNAGKNGNCSAMVVKK